MELTRTANAGVLLKLDGITVLLDGVCREVKPYSATPPEIKTRLLQEFPDAVAFTHSHKDHYDPAFASAYQGKTGRVIFGPNLPGCNTTQTPDRVGDVQIIPVASRHIGVIGKYTPHFSFILQGSRCVWFLGDASPGIWRQKQDLPKPDVVIVPYAYATTPASWQMTKSLGAEEIVVLHLPSREQDEIGLWDALDNTIDCKNNLHIPNMGDTITLL